MEYLETLPFDGLTSSYCDISKDVLMGIYSHCELKYLLSTVIAATKNYFLIYTLHHLYYWGLIFIRMVCVISKHICLCTLLAYNHVT